MLKHSYGWKRDLPDHRDLVYIPTYPIATPTRIDLRSKCPPIYDQGQLGSCTANAIAGHLDFNRKKQGEAFITPSRLFIYYNERLADGDPESDGGSSIRESAKEVSKQGACPESEWPYITDVFDEQPPAECYTDAIKYEALKYQSVPRASMEACLTEGYPFVAGISVYESFEGTGPAKTGKVPLPKKSESLLGGHAILIVGYTPTEWIFRNSWGKSWGALGYGYLPKSYLTNSGLSSDFWTLRQVK